MRTRPRDQHRPASQRREVRIKGQSMMNQPLIIISKAHAQHTAPTTSHTPRADTQKHFLGSGQEDIWDTPRFIRTHSAIESRRRAKAVSKSQVDVIKIGNTEGPRPEFRQTKQGSAQPGPIQNCPWINISENGSFDRADAPGGTGIE